MSEPAPGALDLIAGLKELETITGSETFNWKGHDVLCTARTLTETSNWEVAGLADGSTERLYVRKQTFLTADSTLVSADSTLWTADAGELVPVSGKTITFRGKLWRINSAREASTRSHYELDVISADK